MQTSWLVAAVAAVVVVAALALGWRLLNGDSSLLRNVVVNKETISPNADGTDDATLISYEISRNATVSIFFENATGDRFYFRQEKPRGAGEYSVLFSGVVDGYLLPDEQVEGEVLTRLLQDGVYTWWLTAVDESGTIETAQGQLTIADADPELPEMRNFTLSKHTFSPNRDGIDDRVQAQLFLAQGCRRFAGLFAYARRAGTANYGAGAGCSGQRTGRHYFDYEGGVDNGETPPPDGTYPIFAVAQDLEGQRMRVQSEMTLQFGGVPRADIFAPPNGETVAWDLTAVALCDTINFTLTISNYGNTPIRTTGPAPGTIYDSDWNYNTLGWHTESGAWRVAIGYENELTNYPYRWAIGNIEDLQEIDGYYYLMPGDRAVVTGGIRVVDVFGDRNPQPIWAGLIHEDVEIAQFNTHVDPNTILVDIPDAANRQPCSPRDIPQKPENP